MSSLAHPEVKLPRADLSSSADSFCALLAQQHELEADSGEPGFQEGPARAYETEAVCTLGPSALPLLLRAPASTRSLCGLWLEGAES